MKSEDLRALQAPFKARYRDAPEDAVITLSATGALGDGVSCSVDTGAALVDAGLHPSTGGSGLQACSGDMLLQALVACAGVTLSAVATALSIELESGRVTASGDIDMRGTLGMKGDAPVGFSAIRLRFDLVSGAPAEKLDKLVELTERYCVVYRTLCGGVPVAVERSVAAGRASAST